MYKRLNKNIFEKGEYKLVPIRREDRYSIMKWRNEQIYHLRQNKLLTLEEQDYYFDHIVSKLFNQENPSQILFSFLKNGVCIGYGGLVHINWLDENAEISFLMDTTLEINEFEYLWNIYLDLLEAIAFDELKFHKIYTYAFDLRPKLYPIFESRGYTKDAVLRDHILIGGRYKDVIIHSKINSNG